MKPSVLKGFRLYRHFPGVQIFFADVTPTHSCQSEVRVHGGVGPKSVPGSQGICATLSPSSSSTGTPQPLALNRDNYLNLNYLS